MTNKKSDENKVKGLPTFPFISVITPTYNRRKFIPYIIECYKSQTYPKDKMEWIIYDDGSDPVKDIFDNQLSTIPNIRYIYESEKQNIGVKRNRLNKEAKGDIIIAMDDDDYYPPERVSHVVNLLRANTRVELAGASEIYMFYSDIKKIYKMGPYNANHATNGTMAWKRTYSDSHLYDETVTHAEEHSFLEDYKHPMVQLNAFKTMLVMSHTENTFDKKRMRDGSNSMVKETSLRLRDFIKDKKLRDFYETA